MQTTERKTIVDVAVGVIVGENGAYLITQRQQGQHLAGYWEFPGGKVDVGETIHAALERELEEELGLFSKQFISCDFLVKIEHEYPEKKVRLHTFIVQTSLPQTSESFVARENQKARWINKSELKNVTFPDANKAIVSALRGESYE